MSAKKQTRPSANPTPVRFTPEQVNLIEETAALLGMSRQDVIRLAVTAGLKLLKESGHDGLASMLVERALGRKRTKPPD